MRSLPALQRLSAALLSLSLTPLPSLANPLPPTAATAVNNNVFSSGPWNLRGGFGAQNATVPIWTPPTASQAGAAQSRNLLNRCGSNFASLGIGLSAQSVPTYIDKSGYVNFLLCQTPEFTRSNSPNGFAYSSLNEIYQPWLQGGIKDFSYAVPRPASQPPGPNYNGQFYAFAANAFGVNTNAGGSLNGQLIGPVALLSCTGTCGELDRSSSQPNGQYMSGLYVGDNGLAGNFSTFSAFWQVPTIYSPLYFGPYQSTYSEAQVQFNPPEHNPYSSVYLPSQCAQSNIEASTQSALNNCASGVGYGLVPAFMGGTLFIALKTREWGKDRPADVFGGSTTIADSFMVGAPVLPQQPNVIEAMGYNATFTGSFSDLRLNLTLQQDGNGNPLTYSSVGDLYIANNPSRNLYYRRSPWSGAQLAEITFSGASPDYNGNIIVSPQATLVAANALALGSTTGITTVQAGGSLGLSGSLTLRERIDLNGAGVLGQRGALWNKSGDNTLSGPVLLVSDAAINVASGSLLINSTIGGSGGMVKTGPGPLTLLGDSIYLGNTDVRQGSLIVGEGSVGGPNPRAGRGSIRSNVLVEPGARLSGGGTIYGDVLNFGTLAPGNSIGMLTIDGGSFLQDENATLEIEVAAARQSDLLRLTNSSAAQQVVLLEGTMNISSFQGASITPGVVYTAVEVPRGTVGADPDLFASTGGVAGTSGYQFVRDEDKNFTLLENGQARPDPDKLQFGWIQLNPKGRPISTSTSPGRSTINRVRQSGGALTAIITGNSPTLSQTCTSNTGLAVNCQAALSSGGSGGRNSANPNNIGVAKLIDAGISSLHSAVAQGVTGGSALRTPLGGNSGYTSNQAKAALITPDFIEVYNALYAIPTRSELNQALHSITAEPYASMQSVALEAMEQFRSNALSLSDSSRAIRLFEEASLCSTPDGRQVRADSAQRPADCVVQKVPQPTRWSLLLDGTNTQANLEGTKDLASLDYNIFQSLYGLQYDASRQWSVGAAFGYGQANLYNYEYSNASIDSDTYSLGVWGIYRPSDPWKLSALIGYTNFQYESERNLQFGNIDRNATAIWSGDGFNIAFEAEYDWILSANKNDRQAIRLKPSALLSYALHNQGSITESGAGSLNLQLDGHTSDSLVAGLGITLETPLAFSRTTRLIPRFSAAYNHDFNGDANEEHDLQSSFDELPALGSVEVLGQNRGANDLNVGVTLELETSDEFSLYAGVSGSFWSNGQELSYGGGLRWRFGGSARSQLALGDKTAKPASLSPMMPAAPVRTE